MFYEFHLPSLPTLAPGADAAALERVSARAVLRVCRRRDLQRQTGEDSDRRTRFLGPRESKYWPRSPAAGSSPDDLARVDGTTPRCRREKVHLGARLTTAVVLQIWQWCPTGGAAVLLLVTGSTDTGDGGVRVGGCFAGADAPHPIPPLVQPSQPSCSAPPKGLLALMAGPMGSCTEHIYYMCSYGDDTDWSKLTWHEMVSRTVTLKRIMLPRTAALLLVSALTGAAAFCPAALGPARSSMCPPSGALSLAMSAPRGRGDRDRVAARGAAGCARRDVLAAVPLVAALGANAALLVPPVSALCPPGAQAPCTPLPAFEGVMQWPAALTPDALVPVGNGGRVPAVGFGMCAREGRCASSRAGASGARHGHGHRGSGPGGALLPGSTWAPAVQPPFLAAKGLQGGWERGGGCWAVQAPRWAMAAGVRIQVKLPEH